MFYLYNLIVNYLYRKYGAPLHNFSDNWTRRTSHLKVVSYLILCNHASSFHSMLSIDDLFLHKIILTIFQLQAVGGESPRGVIESISDIFLVLSKNYNENMFKWMHEAIPREGYPSPRVSKEEKEQFVKAILRSVNSGCLEAKVQICTCLAIVSVLNQF